MEEALKKYVVSPFQDLSQIVFENIDESFLQSFFASVPKQMSLVRSKLALWQNGNLQSYAFYFALGLLGFLILIFIR